MCVIPLIMMKSVLILNERHDHSVEVVEEQEEVEAQLDEGLSLLLVQGSEDFGGVQQMVVVANLESIEHNQWQVDHKGEPVARQQEHQRQCRVDARLRKDIHVQLVAKLDWVDVVAL